MKRVCLYCIYIYTSIRVCRSAYRYRHRQGVSKPSVHCHAVANNSSWEHQLAERRPSGRDAIWSLLGDAGLLLLLPIAFPPPPHPLLLLLFPPSLLLLLFLFLLVQECHPPIGQRRPVAGRRGRRGRVEMMWPIGMEAVKQQHGQAPLLSHTHTGNCDELPAADQQ